MGFSLNRQTAVIELTHYGRFHGSHLCPKATHEVNMAGNEHRYFDLDTVALLRETLDDAWASLRPGQQATMQKTALAECMLECAGTGERDPARLREAALMATNRDGLDPPNSGRTI